MGEQTQSRGANKYRYKPKDDDKSKSKMTSATAFLPLLFDPPTMRSLEVAARSKHVA